MYDADAATHDDAGALLGRAVELAFGTDFERRLRAAKVEYVAHGGARSLEQCLRLPQSPAKRRALVRNAWLRVALRELQATDAKATPGALHAELNRFVDRGSWSRWADAGGPPATASRLYSALFCAVQANRGRALCRKHVVSILEQKEARFFRAPLVQCTHERHQP